MSTHSETMAKVVKSVLYSTCNISQRCTFLACVLVLMPNYKDRGQERGRVLHP